jgi:hypothetical protein
MIPGATAGRGTRQLGGPAPPGLPPQSRLAGWLPALAGLLIGLLALGPALARGFVLTYDMVFVPDPPFSSALLGLAGGPARPVPSDAVVAVAALVIPADILQKLVLLAIFVLACAGVAALLEREPLLARLAGGVFYAWNPYVGERLIIGQWALLLGYAGLPWVLRALLAPDLGKARGAGRLALAMLPAIVGGFASMAITALVVVPTAVLGRSLRRAATSIGVLIVGCLPWFIPSLLHTVYADPAGVAAFASRADTPFGTVGSVLMLGGMWNADAVPKGYGGGLSVLWLGVVLCALAGFVAGVRRWPGLASAAVAGLLIACLGVTSGGQDALRSLIGAWPGAAVLRDAQQFAAPLALAEACGLGVSVAWAMHHRSLYEKDLAGVLIGVVALAAPVVLLPGVAWGAAGRLRPVWYPAGWLAAARTIDASPVHGDVLVLPWVADRTPPWNHGEAMLDPWPRLLSRPVIWNDGTQVGNLKLAPDDPRALRLDGVVSGGGPLTAALRAAGVRFVVDDPDGPGQSVRSRLPGATVIVAQPGLTVYRLPG